MALSLLVNPTAFFKAFKPHLPFRFEVEFYGLPTSNDSVIKYAVESVKISGTECDTTKGAMYLGNATTKTIPIYNIASRSIQISFEETDDMKILKTLDSIAERQRSGLPYVVGIRVKEFNAEMSSVVSDKYYSCILTDYTEPTFARSGGVQLVKSDATFMIMAENAWASDKGGDIGKMIAQYGEGVDDNLKKIAKDNVSYIDEMKKKAAADAEEQRKAGNFYTGANTKDFTVDTQEVNGIYNKIKSEYKNVTLGRGFFGERFQSEEDEKEALRDVLTTNAKLMSEAFSRLKNTLERSGVTVSINAYNDSGHATGLGTSSGSHLLGQKIDLNFTMNGKKLTTDGAGGTQKMSAATLNTIINAAKTAGLVANWEQSGNAGSTWGDFALDAKSSYNSGKMKSITKNGEVITLSKTSKWSSWTGETKVFNTSQKKKTDII